MSIRENIEKKFGENAFLKPLFYSSEGGLRFELSQSGSSIHQFLSAINRASHICQDIFHEDDVVVLCIRCVLGSNKYAHRSSIRQLKEAGISIPKKYDLWLVELPVDDRLYEDKPEYVVSIAFHVSIKIIESALWCALAVDFPSIRPNPRCLVYIFNMTKSVMVHPYDDRGMDVAGYNHDCLKSLYIKHNKMLLPYDIDKMRTTFGAL